MYTIKIEGTGTITFRNKPVRVPVILKRVSDKELKFIQVICRAQSLCYEILEAESNNLARVAKKLHDDIVIKDIDGEIEKTEPKIEELFEGNNTLDKLLDVVGKE